MDTCRQRLFGEGNLAAAEVCRMKAARKLAQFDGRKKRQGLQPIQQVEVRVNRVLVSVHCIALFGYGCLNLLSAPEQSSYQHVRRGNNLRSFGPTDLRLMMSASIAPHEWLEGNQSDWFPSSQRPRGERSAQMRPTPKIRGAEPASYYLLVRSTTTKTIRMMPPMPIPP